MFRKVLPNGLGQALGNSIAVNTPFYTTGYVWYVHAEDGEDSDGITGQSAQRPLATLAQAQTNASDGDVIVLMDGHEESINSLAITKRLLIVGGGQSGGRPTVKVTPTTNADALEITADGVELRNIWFEEQAVSSSASANLIINASRVRVVDCYFETGIYDSAGVSIQGTESSVELEGCTFVSTSTDPDELPDQAVELTGTITDLRIRDCVFDGGTLGWSEIYAIYAADGTVTDLRIENVSLLRGADVLLDADTTGYVAGITATGAANIVFEEDEEPA
jgi:uncharacterized protein YuzE